MNMMRYDIDELQIDAKLIDSSKVIEGYIYLSEEIAEEKLKERQERRTTFLFVLLLICVGIYVWDKQLLAQGSKIVQSYHSQPTSTSQALTLNTVLSGIVVEKSVPQAVATESEVIPVETVDVIPEDIIQFIDTAASDERVVTQAPKIVLEEVKVEKSNQLDIERILASGNKLYKRDRLMSPPIHNAFARYEKVLSVHPNHPEALKGIENIVNRYVSLAEMVIAKNEHYKVPELIKKAYQAGEKYMDVSIIIAQFSEYLSNDSLFTEQPAVAEAQVPAPQEQPEKAQEDFHIDTIFIADNKIAEAAYKLYIDGDMASAEKMLNNFTKLSGFWGESNDLLLNIYLSNDQIAKAENLIYENKALDAYQFAEKAARIMMKRGDSEGALNMLSAYRPEFLENKAYYTLLASLYHKTGDFNRAVYWYRQLLSVNHKNARLWLGLAVSLDALNNADGALQAFDYVRLYAQNESAVESYINERQIALASEVTADEG